MSRPPSMPQRELALIIGLLLLLMFVSPIANWWAVESAPWYTAYLIWGGIILLAALLALRNPDDEP